MSNKLDFEKDLHIDEANLDLEYLNHGNITAKYGEYLALCRDKQRRCDQKVKLIRSELIDKANRNPQKYLKLVKPTIDTVNAFYRNNPRHQAAKEALMDAEFELEMAQIAFDEIKGRKHTIQGLAKLYADKYFAGPAIPLDIIERRKERDESRKEANSKIRLGKKKRSISDVTNEKRNKVKRKRKRRV